VSFVFNAFVFFEITVNRNLKLLFIEFLKSENMVRLNNSYFVSFLVVLVFIIFVFFALDGEIFLLMKNGRFLE